MADYISRRAVIDGIAEYYKDKKYIARHRKILSAICLDLRSVIYTLPSADVHSKDEVTKAFSDGFEAGHKRGYERGKEDGIHIYVK